MIIPAEGIPERELWKVIDADHVYDKDNWEASYDRTCSDVLFEDIDFMDPKRIMKVGAFKVVPVELFAARVPISWDEHGDIDEQELRIFPSQEAAQAALERRG
jgi:hypothetical protein